MKPAELERERQVVLQELGQARDTPDDIIFDHLQNVIYQDQPLGWPILGDEKTVDAFTPVALRDYSGAALPRRSHDPGLLPARSLMARSLRMAEEKFAGLMAGCGASKSAGALCRRRHPRRGRSGAGPCRLCLSRASPPIDADFYIAQLYAMVLGGGMSSRLFQEVREKRGLCYSIYAFTNNFQDGGFTGIYVGTGEAEAGEVSAVIAGEMEAL